MITLSVCLQIVFYILYSVSILLHLLGLVSLVDVYRGQVKTVQDLYLINLCFVELLRNMMSILGLTAFLYPNDPTWSSVFDAVIVISGFSLVFTNYVAMICVTLDRLMLCLFDVEYSLYWNLKKAKILIGCTWMMAVYEAIGVQLAVHFSGFRNKQKLDMYAKTFLDCVFCILSVVTYTCIARQYIASTKARPAGLLNDTSPKGKTKCTLVIFRKSRFYVMIIIVATFLFFIAIPDLMILYTVFSQNEVPFSLLIINYLLGAVSDIIHCFVYMFVKKDVRKRIREFLCLSKWKDAYKNSCW